MTTRAQVNGVSTRVEGALEGLTPGRHALAVHAYGAASGAPGVRWRASHSRASSVAGDLTLGAASTGPVLSHEDDAAAGAICVIEADASGRAEFLNAALNPSLQVRRCV